MHGYGAYSWESTTVTLHNWVARCWLIRRVVSCSHGSEFAVHLLGYDRPADGLKLDSIRYAIRECAYDMAVRPGLQVGSIPLLTKVAWHRLVNLWAISNS